MKTIMGWACGALLSLMATTAAQSQSSDVHVLITGPAGPLAPGDAVAYGASVENNGPDPAVNVAYDFILPAGLTFVSATPGVGTCSVQAAKVECFAGVLPPGSPFSTTIHLRVDASAAPNSTMLTRLEASSGGHDPDLSNNSDTTFFKIAPPPPTPVPTLSEWAMIALSVLLAGGAALHLERRRRAA